MNRVQTWEWNGNQQWNLTLSRYRRQWLHWAFDNNRDHVCCRRLTSLTKDKECLEGSWNLERPVDWTIRQYRYPFHTLQVSPGDGNGPRTFGCQSNAVKFGGQCRSHGWTAHEGRLVFYCIKRYGQSFCLSNSPHAFTTPLLPGSFSLSPYTINIHLPSFPYHLLFRLSYIPPPLPPFHPSESSLCASLIRHLSITSNASQGYQDCRVCLSLYQDIANPWRPVLFYRQLQASKVWTRSTFSRRVFLSPLRPKPLSLGLPGPPWARVTHFYRLDKRSPNPGLSDCHCVLSIPPAFVTSIHTKVFPVLWVILRFVGRALSWEYFWSFIPQGQPGIEYLYFSNLD